MQNVRDEATEKVTITAILNLGKRVQMNLI